MMYPKIFNYEGLENKKYCQIYILVSQDLFSKKKIVVNAVGYFIHFQIKIKTH